jgi:hypothetical protein
MRTYIKKTITKEVEELQETKCDLCGKIAKCGHWESSCWDVNDVELDISIVNKTGKSYPETSWGTTYMVDMCPECFQKKLIPWLESQGATILEREWDY